MSLSPRRSTPSPCTSRPVAGSPGREQRVGARCQAEVCQHQHSVQPGQRRQELGRTVVPLRTRWSGTLLDNFPGILCLCHSQMPWRSMKSTWMSAGRPSLTTSAKICCMASRPRTPSAAAGSAKPGARTARSAHTGPPVSRVAWASIPQQRCGRAGLPPVMSCRVGRVRLQRGLLLSALPKPAQGVGEPPTSPELSCTRG